MPIRRLSPQRSPDLNPRTANSRTVTAARSTRCVVTGRTRCPGSGSLHPPAQIVEPDRWLQQNSTQEGGQRATEVVYVPRSILGTCTAHL